MMRRVLVATTVVVAAFASAGGVEAQLAGKWSVEFGEWQTGDSGRQVRFPGGNAGELEITARGDSVFATYTAGGLAQELKGRVENGTATLRGTSTGNVNLNGVVSQVTLHTEFAISASAGELKGVHRMGREGQEWVSRSFTARPATQR